MHVFFLNAIQNGICIIYAKEQVKVLPEHNIASTARAFGALVPQRRLNRSCGSNYTRQLPTIVLSQQRLLVPLHESWLSICTHT